MTGSVNKVILVGHLGHDVSVREKGATKVATFSLATTKRWRERDSNERKEHTTWHTVVIFNQGLVDVAAQYLKKGSAVYLEGEIGVRKYTSKDGVERWATEIILPAGFGSCALVLLDRKEGNRPPDAESYSQYGGSSATVPDRPPPGSGRDDDGVPF